MFGLISGTLIVSVIDVSRLRSLTGSPARWQGIEKLICVKRKSIWPLQRIVEAIFYLTKNGIIWRDLPESFPPWQTVYRSGAPVVLPKMEQRRHVDTDFQRVNGDASP